MDMHTLTADVAAARTYWGMLTPYLGLGSDLVLVRETSDAVALHNEAQFVPHVLGGVEARIWHGAVGAEVQQGALTSYQVQLTALF
jgi:hypothetical protein